MNTQPPPHSTYKKTTVNTFLINPDIKNRIVQWNEFLNHGILERRGNVSDVPETVRELSATKNQDDNDITALKRHTSNYVLSYLPEITVGPMRVSLKLDPETLPSFCAGYPNPSSSPPIVSLSSKMHELCAFEADRRKTLSSNNSALLIDVPNVVARAIKCLQYAHMSRLIHGRVCADAFFISAFENPWLPTLCLGELPLLPQFFVNLGSELGRLHSSADQQNDSSSLTPAQQHMKKSAFNQPQASSWWNVLAPEILRKEPYDSSVDVWGIGVLTVQLCMASVGFPADKWTAPALDTKDLRDATLVSPILRGLPPAAVSFATMCLKANPSNRPTLAGLLNHPWLKMMTTSSSSQDDHELASLDKNNDSKKKQENPQPPSSTAKRETDNNQIFQGETKEAATTTQEQKTDNGSKQPTPLSLPSNSAFKGNLDPKKVNEVIAALEKSKKQREELSASMKLLKKDSNDDDSDSDDDEESGSDEEDDEESLSGSSSEEDLDDEEDKDDETSSDEEDD